MRFLIFTLAVAATYSIPFADEALAALIGVLMVTYYAIVYKLKTGLSISVLEDNGVENIQHSTIAVITNLVGVTAVILKTSYAFIGWIALPWVIISILTVATSWLIYFEYIEIRSNDEDET